MKKKPLNQVLAETLQKLMKEKDLTAQKLGGTAGLAPNTVGNYLKWRADDFTPAGQPKSARLLEVELSAAALGVHPLMLLIDPDDQKAALSLVSQITARLSASGATQGAAGDPSAGAQGKRRKLPRLAAA